MIIVMENEHKRGAVGREIMSGKGESSGGHEKVPSVDK
jgi:hypothetical protein